MKIKASKLIGVYSGEFLLKEIEANNYDLIEIGKKNRFDEFCLREIRNNAPLELDENFLHIKEKWKKLSFTGYIIVWFTDEKRIHRHIKICPDYQSIKIEE